MVLYLQYNKLIFFILCSNLDTQVYKIYSTPNIIVLKIKID